MAQRVDRPYWFNWLRWNLYDRHQKDYPVQRRAIWDFFNHIRTMPRGSLVIDCGANVGNVTRAFVRLGFEVHAFEPDPYARQFLERRYGKHPLVTIHPKAVGAAPGRLTLYRKADFARKPKRSTVSSSLLRRPVHGDANNVEVDVIDLSAFIRGLGRRVDILKLDVEGAEVEIIEHLIGDGTSNLIGMIYAETHERHSTELAERTLRLRQRIAAEKIGNINLDWR